MPVFCNWIDGEWVGSTDVAINRNPSDIEDVVGEFARADAGQVDRAVACAKRALVTWSVSGIQQRFDILDRVGNELLARKDELGELLSREEGKTRAEGVGEVTRAGHVFKFFAGEALRPSGDIRPSTRVGMTVEVTREPVGVVGIITPWNFPIAIPSWKIAAALVHGNTVVFKPADWVPASAWALTDILVRAGIPAGVFNLVMGRGSVVGDAMVEHPHVHAVSFTGSQPVGQRMAARLIARMAKIQLEMGGKNPLIVLDDADLDLAVEVAVQGAYFATGQRCTASSRLIVTPAVHDRFVAGMIDRLQTLQIGHALDKDTDIGPVVEEKQLSGDLEYVDIGSSEGARLVYGGERLTCRTHGHFLQPALFTEVNNEMRIAREEIFGPIAAVIRAKNYEEALAIANDTPFGLSSGIVTTSLKHATHFKRHSAAGMVMINAPTAGVDYHVPFGGRKQSSYGSREQGRYAEEFYTAVKTSYIAS